MSNLSSYCGLVDAKIRASDKDLPVAAMLETQFYVLNIYINFAHIINSITNNLFRF